MKTKAIFLLTVLQIVHFGIKVNAQTLKRQALIDFTIKVDAKDANPVLFDEIPAISQFFLAGIKKGDRIVSINDESIINTTIYQKTIRQWRGDAKIKLIVKRNDQILALECTPLPKPFEVIEGCVTSYDEVKTENGFFVRTIVTKPKNAIGKLPVIFFVEWLSCDQVELNRNAMDGWAYLIEDLASKTGCILVRTEKPGLGDSNGPDCSECDLKTEINAYKASFQKMLGYNFIDNENIFVIGGSIGGALAPVVVEGQKIKGLISTGGFSTTWYEHILDFERTRLLYSGTKPEQIDSLVKKFSSFYYEYLIKKKKPSEIITTNPFYQSLWYQSNDLQFGRPVKYYQQLQDLNMSHYWGRVKYPVLVVYGEYDWIMSEAEQKNIVHIVNKNSPGMAELKIIQGMNHHFSKYTSAQEAFEEPFIKYEPSAFEYIHNWIKSVNNK